MTFHEPGLTRFLHGDYQDYQVLGVDKYLHKTKVSVGPRVVEIENPFSDYLWKSREKNTENVKYGKERYLHVGVSDIAEQTLENGRLHLVTRTLRVVDVSNVRITDLICESSI